MKNSHHQLLFRNANSQFRFTSTKLFNNTSLPNKRLIISKFTKTKKKKKAESQVRYFMNLRTVGT